MKFKYIFGAIATNFYRLLKVFPNSDPIMAFILPAAKNEPIWKAPLFAFATMFTFDLLTSGIGTWTWVTATTYSLIALGLRFTMKEKKTSIRLYVGAGIMGVLVFDIIPGPLMSTFLFGNNLLATTFLQIPFTILHLTSATFSTLLITPFLDKQIMKE